MLFYRIFRRVIYDSREKQYHEVWGIDRVPANLPVKLAPRDTDKDDPINGRDDSICAPLLVLKNGDLVTWKKMWKFLSEAEEEGYTLVSGVEKLSPYSTLILKGL